MSPEAYDFSLDETIDDSDDDTEQEEDYSSDNGKMNNIKLKIVYYLFIFSTF